jgi:MoxR-like ATPase
LIRAAKALAAMRGRGYASPQDVFEVAPEILRHRLVLTYDALAREVSVEHVLQRLMATVPAAWVHPGRAHALPDPGIVH